MDKPTFSTPDLTTFCRLDALDLTCIGQHITAHKAVLKCRPNTTDEWCRRCSGHGDIRDTVVRRLAHEPFGHRPTTLHIRLRRYKCIECGHVWRQDTTTAAPARAKISRAGLDWALRALVIDHDTVAVIADKLAVSWHTANSAVLTEGQRLLINDPNRFDDVSVIGVDEHVWRHTRRGDKYVTVIIDLTPISQGTGTARLLDMVPGRSKQVFKQWLAARPKGWRDGIEVVAMDGFSGFKTAAVEELPDAVEVMDPFHVVKLAGDALDDVRRRVQQETTGHRGRAKDPLYRARRTLHTGTDLLTRRQQERIASLFADANLTEVEVTWALYQDIVAAYRAEDRSEGKRLLQAVIDVLSAGLPAGLTELRRLGRTLKRRAADVLAFFTRPGTSNGPTESINGRLEHLRGSALGFRNLTHYIARCLLESGGFRPVLHSRLR
ncbi:MULTISPECIES: ISL3 family transposase [Brevibacterium]|uniref:ISL3 family transposase n=3 Tax=Brevibacterium TaxID=1696 RepID=A0A2A3ZC78_BREAU|nr:MULTISPECIES: ISL3 family transposase [Brevibacterium]AZL07373.1 ISL3 family transposase [Brevibacterium aurantiacum]PCC48955.1 ISL3 family transposase [Brevibacterium aurantiacum]